MRVCGPSLPNFSILPPKKIISHYLASRKRKGFGILSLASYMWDLKNFYLSEPQVFHLQNEVR